MTAREGGRLQMKERKGRRDGGGNENYMRKDFRREVRRDEENLGGKVTQSCNKENLRNNYRGTQQITEEQFKNVLYSHVCALKGKQLVCSHF